MKKLFYFASLLCLCTCSNEWDTALEQQQEKQSAKEVSATHRVDQEKALEQANLILEFPQTRSAADVKVDYVIDEKSLKPQHLRQQRHCGLHLQLGREHPIKK